MTTVWIARVNNIIIGIFNKRHLACYALFDYLCDNKHILHMDSDEYRSKICSELLNRTKAAYNFLEPFILNIDTAKIEKHTLQSNYEYMSKTIPEHNSNLDIDLQTAIEQSISKPEILTLDKMISNVNKSREQIGIPIINLDDEKNICNNKLHTKHHIFPDYDELDINSLDDDDNGWGRTDNQLYLPENWRALLEKEWDDGNDWDENIKLL